MKKLITLFILVVITATMNAQVYTMRYTHYSQTDTISQELQKDIPFNVTVYLDYYHNQISIETDNTKFLLNIISTHGDGDEVFYECRSSDLLEFQVAIIATKKEYNCIVSRDRFTRIYKKQR